MGAVRVDSRSAHAGAPFFVRASLPRTFLGLGVFIETGLLFSGIYLLIDALRSPLEANQAAILAGGAILALAVVLLFYLIQPLRRTALAEPRERIHTESLTEDLPLTAYGNAIKTRLDAAHALQHKSDLPGPM